jgi:hypothetical protein
MTAYIAKTYVNSANIYQNVSIGIISTRDRSLTDPHSSTSITKIPAPRRSTYVGGAYLGGVGKTFKMRGWYSTGSVYEYWTTTSPSTQPPSGHTLTDITIMGKY